MERKTVSVIALAENLKSQANQSLGAGDEHEKDQDQDHESEHADEKIINEGSYNEHLSYLPNSNRR
jgi:ABC-type Zn2+ transport system substrate-binding protein/surface adhesin